MSRHPTLMGAFQLFSVALLSLLPIESVTSHVEPYIQVVASETNLKIKQALPTTTPYTSPALIASLGGHLLSEAPNASLHTYTGSLHLNDPTSGGQKTHPLGPDQVLLRGAQIRNTGWIYGIVVVGGKETKLMRNAT